MIHSYGSVALVVAVTNSSSAHRLLEAQERLAEREPPADPT
jgi:hypothetical protein